MAGRRSFRSSRAFLVRAADLGGTDRRLTFFTEAAGGGTDLESAPGIVSFRGRACPDSGSHSIGITGGYTEIPGVELGEAAQEPGGRPGREKPVKPLFL